MEVCFFKPAVVVLPGLVQSLPVCVSVHPRKNQWWGSITRSKVEPGAVALGGSKVEPCSASPSGWGSCTRTKQCWTWWCGLPPDTGFRFWPKSASFLLVELIGEAARFSGAAFFAFDAQCCVCAFSFRGYWTPPPVSYKTLGSVIFARGLKRFMNLPKILRQIGIPFYLRIIHVDDTPPHSLMPAAKLKQGCFTFPNECRTWVSHNHWRAVVTANWSHLVRRLFIHVLQKMLDSSYQTFFLQTGRHRKLRWLLTKCVVLTPLSFLSVSEQSCDSRWNESQATGRILCLMLENWPVK